MTALMKTDMWAQFVDEVAGGGYVSTFGDVLRDVTAGDVVDLSATLIHGRGAQRSAALALLVSLGRGGSPLLPPEVAKSLCPALLEIAAAGYPSGKEAQSAVALWRTIDFVGAADFVNAWVDRTRIPDADVSRVTMDLSFGNAESFKRLRQIAETHPNVKLGSNAANVLERTAPDWPQKRLEYGRRWQTNRDCETLLHLTNQLIDRRPREDAFIGEILETMGQPDSVVSGCYTFLTREVNRPPGSLFLETDNEGKVVGWKLDNC